MRKKKDSAAGTREGWDLLPEILSRIVPPTFPNCDFKVTDYGAVGDGVTDCNPAFKKAIAACTKAGGGWPKLEENRRKLVIPENPNGDDDGYTNLEEWLYRNAAEVEGTGK